MPAMTEMLSALEAGPRGYSYSACSPVAPPVGKSTTVMADLSDIPRVRETKFELSKG
jgi:hypothetical protein